MQLHDYLKQLKSIEPDREYTRRSRLSIIGDQPMPVVSGWRHILVHNLQFGAAIAVMAAVLLIVFGGTSLTSVFSPFHGTALDVSSLKAEAQDVDIQVELAKMSYPQVAISKKTAPSPTAIKKISEVVVDNKKDIADLKQTNAELSQPAVAPMAATSVAPDNETSTTSTDSRIMGVSPMMATSVSTSSTSTEVTSTTSTGAATSSASAISAAPKVQSTSTEITPDQLLDQLSQ